MFRLVLSRCRLLGAFVCAVVIYSFLYKSLSNNVKEPSDANFSQANSEITDKAFFEVSISDNVIGKFTVGLYGNIVPKTVKNFVALSQGFQEVFFSYKGSKFHRVIKNFMIQGGDIMRGNFSGPFSLYGGPFPDENFILKHLSEGWVSMANGGADTNGCQFFITLEATPWLDNKHVVFGRVLEGMDVVKKIGDIPTNESDSPLDDVVIVNCGILAQTD